MRRLIHPVRWHRERRWRRAAAQWQAAQLQQRGQQRPIRRSLAQVRAEHTRAGA